LGSRGAATGAGAAATGAGTAATGAGAAGTGAGADTTGAGSGADVRVSLAVVYAVRDGLIVRGQEFLDPQDALNAVGLEE